MKRDAALGPGAFGFHAEPRGQPSRVGEGGRENWPRLSGLGAQHRLLLWAPDLREASRPTGKWICQYGRMHCSCTQGTSEECMTAQKRQLLLETSGKASEDRCPPGFSCKADR